MGPAYFVYPKSSENELAQWNFKDRPTTSQVSLDKKDNLHSHSANKDEFYARKVQAEIHNEMKTKGFYTKAALKANKDGVYG